MMSGSAGARFIPVEEAAATASSCPPSPPLMEDVGEQGSFSAPAMTMLEGGEDEDDSADEDVVVGGARDDEGSREGDVVPPFPSRILWVSWCCFMLP